MLAKLNHNLTVHHDLVNRNLFNADLENCYILTNSKLNECQQILHQFIIDNGYDCLFNPLTEYITLYNINTVQINNVMTEEPVDLSSLKICISTGIKN